MYPYFFSSSLQSKPEQYVVLDNAKLIVSLWTKCSTTVLVLIVMGDIAKKSSNRIGGKQVNSFVKFSVIEVHFNTYQTGDDGWEHLCYAI